MNKPIAITIALLAVLLLMPFDSIAKKKKDGRKRCVYFFKDTALVRQRLLAAYDTLHFLPGEKIADIGAKGGNMSGILSMNYENIDITLEDIDTFCNNEAQVKEVMQYYALLCGHPANNIRTHVVTGNDTSTTLPANTYQKVFLLNTFHEISQTKQMLADLYSITAPNGILYVMEQVSSKKKMKRHDCNHIMPIRDELIKAFTEAGFHLLKTNVTDKYHRKGDLIEISYFHFVKG